MVVLAFAGAAALRCFPALLWPLTNDEAGFVLVARQWDPVPDHLYGDFWVDRPPQLIAVFAIGDAVAGPYGPRLLVVALSVASVLCAHRIGTLVGGRRAARWTAGVVLVVTSWPHLITWTAKSESLGVPFVLISSWLFVESMYRGDGRAAKVTAFLAGLAAALAMGMKQSLIGGAVFGAVLLAACWSTGRLERRTALAHAGAAAGGLLLPVGVTVGWVLANGLSPSLLWDVLYGFRVDALDTIADVESPANDERAMQLVLISLFSGLAIVIGWFLVVLRRVARTHPELAAATAVVLVVDVAGLALGGSYWPAYLHALVPPVALMTALTCTLRGARGEVPRFVVLLSVMPLVASLAATPVLRGSAEDTSSTGVAIGRAVQQAARSGDSIVVVYGAPQIVWASGLDAPYRYLWSLPVRTLDPDLDELHRVVSGPDPPTWIVIRGPLDTWGLDPSGRVRDTVTQRYEKVARLCTNNVWRLRATTRPDVPPVDCARRLGPLDDP